MSGKGHRIGFVTSSYPSGPNDPRGIFVARIASALAQQGVEVHVTATGSARSPVLEYPDGVTVTFIRYWPGQQPLTRNLVGISATLQQRPWLVVQIPSLLARMARSVRKLADKVDLVHAHWLYPAGIAALIGMIGQDVPLVVTSHGSDLRLATNIPPLKWISTTVAGRAAACIGVNRQLCGQLIDWGVPHNRVYFLPVGVPTDVDLSSPETEFPQAFFQFRQADGLRVLFVGSLTKLKSPITLLEAIHLLQKKGLAIASAFLGDGPELKGLETYVRENDIFQVWMPGTVPPPQVQVWMKAADVLVLPSLNDAWGSVVPEAMAVGTPAIVSDNVGSAELIETGSTGYRFPPGDYRMLAQELERLSSLTQLERKAMSDASRRQIRRRGLDLQHVAEQHVNIYSAAKSLA